MDIPAINYKFLEFIYFDNKLKYESVIIECLNHSQKIVNRFGGLFEPILDQSKGQSDAIVKETGIEIDFKLIISEDFMSFKRRTSPYYVEAIPGLKIQQFPDPQEKKVLLLFNVLRNMTFERLEEYRKSKGFEAKSITHFFDDVLNVDKNILLFNPLLLFIDDKSMSEKEQLLLIHNEISDKIGFINDYREQINPGYETYMVYGFFPPITKALYFVISEYTSEGLKIIDTIDASELQTIQKLGNDNFWNI